MMHDDRDNSAFAVKPLLDIDAVVDAYVEADHVRQVAERLWRRHESAIDWGISPAQQSEIFERSEMKRLRHIREILLKWADAREASVAKMLEGE